MSEEPPIEHELFRQARLPQMRRERFPDLASDGASVPFVAPLEAMRKRQRGLLPLEPRKRAAVVMTERVTVDNFRSDPMFVRIERAVAAVLMNGKVVAPVDVLVKMAILAPKDLED